MFGPNINDADYIMEARKYIDKDSTIMNITEELINKIYEVEDRDIFKKVKEKYNYVRVIVATNHVSFIRNYIGESLDIQYLDDLVISAEVHKVKPNVDFYKHILDKYNIKADEMLFLDDNSQNIESAKELGIHTIKVSKNMNLYDEICNYINQNT